MTAPGLKWRRCVHLKNQNTPAPSSKRGRKNRSPKIITMTTNSIKIKRRRRRRRCQWLMSGSGKDVIVKCIAAQQWKLLQVPPLLLTELTDEAQWWPLYLLNVCNMCAVRVMFSIQTNQSKHRRNLEVLTDFNQQNEKQFGEKAKTLTKNHPTNCNPLT